METEQQVPDAPTVASLNEGHNDDHDTSPTTAAVPTELREVPQQASSSFKPVVEPVAAVTKPAPEPVVPTTTSPATAAATSTTTSKGSKAKGEARGSIGASSGSSSVRRILLWDDIVITAKWVVSLYGAVYLLFFNTTSLISFVALVLLAAVLANIAYVNAYAAYCSFKQQAYEHPNQRSLDRGGLVAIDKDWALAQTSAVIDELNRQSVALAQIVYCADSMTSFKAAGALYGIVVVASALPTGWLCIVALTAAFLGPVGYSMRFVDIDKVITLAEQKIKAAVAVAAAKARPVLQRLPFVKPKAE